MGIIKFITRPIQFHSQNTIETIMKAYVCRVGEDKVTQSGKSCASSALPQLCAYMATFAGL